MKKLSTYFAILIFALGAAQTSKIDSLQLALSKTNNAFEKAKTSLKLALLYERIDLSKGLNYANEAKKYKDNDSLNAETANQLGRLYFFTGQLDSAIVYFETSKSILKKLNEDERAASVNISLGAILLRQGNYQKTIEILTKSASFFEDNNNQLNVAKCYSNISSAFAELNNYTKAIAYAEKALAIFEKNKLTQFQLITLPNLATQYFKNGDTLRAIKNYYKAEVLATTMNNKRSLSMIYNNLGNIYLNSDIDKSEAYLLRALKLKNELNFIDGIEITKSNLGYIYLKKNEFAKALSILNDALPSVKGKQRVLVYNYLTEAYQKTKKLNIALEFSEKSRLLNDSLLSVDNQKTILEIQTKYETKKKENEILKLESENLEANYQKKQNFYLFIGALLALSLAIFSIYFLQKNAKRKRIIMQQNLKIKEQDFDQLLQEKELEGIGNILEAQEKERSKMAAELHDNLGSKVATLKLLLESSDNTKNFASNYAKLKTLISETYNDIRNISKNKNFGAQISSGLIPSTKAIANQISDTKKIKIDVINIDVKKRIENNIEIQIFRILQELITNILKHAKATEATIQFSEENNLLNIMVEDNGKGFDVNQNTSGTGLSNIEKRVEKMNGTLAIDSDKGNGTTIILNIPI